jgi:hypothetical protein
MVQNSKRWRVTGGSHISRKQQMSRRLIEAATTTVMT